MSDGKPNRRYDHAFAIVRIDKFVASDVHPEAAIAIKRVVWDQQIAETEVARLNRLNQEKGAVYFWQVTRVDRRASRDGINEQ